MSIQDQINRHDGIAYDFFSQEKKKGKEYETHYRYSYFRANGFMNVQYGYRIGEWDPQSFSNLKSFRNEMIHQAAREYNEAPMIFVIPKDDYKTFGKALEHFEQDESKALYFFHDWVRHLVKADRLMRKQYQFMSAFKTINALLKSRPMSRGNSQTWTPVESEEDKSTEEKKETKGESVRFEDCKDCQELETKRKLILEPKTDFVEYYVKYVASESESMMTNVNNQFKNMSKFDIKRSDSRITDEQLFKFDKDVENFEVFCRTHRAKMTDIPNCQDLCDGLDKYLTLCAFMKEIAKKFKNLSRIGTEMDQLGEKMENLIK